MNSEKTELRKKGNMRKIYFETDLENKNFVVNRGRTEKV